MGRALQAGTLCSALTAASPSLGSGYPSERGCPLTLDCEQAYQNRHLCVRCVCGTEVGIADTFAKQPEPIPRHAHPVDSLSPVGSEALGQIRCLPPEITSELIPPHGLISSETECLAPQVTALWPVAALCQHARSSVPSHGSTRPGLTCAPVLQHRYSWALHFNPMCDTQLLFAFREQATQGPASTELSAFALRFLTLPQRLVSQPWHRFTLTFVKTNQSSRAAPRCCSLCSYVIFMVQRPAGVHRAGAWMGQGCHRNGAAREKWEEVGEAGRGTLLPTDWVRFPAVWFNCLSSFCVVHGKEAFIAGDCRKMLVNCTKWKDFLSQKKSLEEGVEGAGGRGRREDSENWTVHCAESRSRDGLAGKGERRRMGRGQCLASSTQKQKAIFKMYGFGFFFFWKKWKRDWRPGIQSLRSRGATSKKSMGLDLGSKRVTFAMYPHCLYFWDNLTERSYDIWSPSGAVSFTPNVIFIPM